MIKKFIISPLFFLVVFLILIETIVSVLPQQIFGMLIDNLSKLQNSGRYIVSPFVQYLAEHTVIRDFSLLLALYFLFAVLSLGLSIARGYFVTFFGEKVIKAIRQRLFSGLLRAKPSYLNQLTSGELSVQLMSDVEGIRNLLISPINGIFVDAITAILIVVICFKISPVLTIVMLVPTPFVIFFGFYLGNKQVDLSHKHKHLLSDLTTTTINRLKGFMLFKIFAQENLEESKYFKLLSEYFANAIKSVRITLGLFPITNGTQILVSVCIIAIGSFQVDKQQISVGELIVFIQYLSRVYNPIINVSRFYNSIAVSLVSYKRVRGVFASIRHNQEENIKDSYPIREKIDSYHLRFENVEFDYEATNRGKNLISDFNLAVRNGDKVSIVGSSGSGKTTILNLVIKLVSPISGTIYFRGTDVNLTPLAALRKDIGYITQNTILYNIPLFDNVRYGNQTATKQDVINALTKVNLEHLAKNEKLFSIAGENGELLSGGEKQRISIARLILCNPGLILLDEPISNLDEGNAKNILDMIFRIFADKTIIITSHQKLTLSYTDKVVRLDYPENIELQ